MPSEPTPLLVCDFDGTITRVDVGDALCARFASPRWVEIDEQWLRGELTLPEAQRQMWGLVRATPDELVAHAREVGALRQGADALFDAVRAGALELVIASGGFHLYIDALLGERLQLASAVYANRLEALPERRVRPVFPEGLGCERDAVCKGVIVQRHRGRGRSVAFCGDGSSDRCAAGVADRTFAVVGGILEAHCNETGVRCVGIEDLGEVVDRLLSDAH